MKSVLHRTTAVIDAINELMSKTLRVLTSVKELRFVLVQGIVNDVFSQQYQHYLLKDVTNDRTDSSLCVVKRCENNVFQNVLDKRR